MSGGYSPSVFNALQTAIDASKALAFTKLKANGDHDETYKTLDHHEALYTATLGGAKG